MCRIIHNCKTLGRTQKLFYFIEFYYEILYLKLLFDVSQLSSFLNLLFIYTLTAVLEVQYIFRKQWNSALLDLSLSSSELKVIVKHVLFLQAMYILG